MNAAGGPLLALSTALYSFSPWARDIDDVVDRSGPDAALAKKGRGDLDQPGPAAGSTALGRAMRGQAASVYIAF
jgi:hypothetical protein